MSLRARVELVREGARINQLSLTSEALTLNHHSTVLLRQHPLGSARHLALFFSSHTQATALLGIQAFDKGNN